MIQVEGFNVRIISTGESYGLDDCFTHEGDDAMVEFYDALNGCTNPIAKSVFGPRGQFVTRYYIYQLIARNPGLGRFALDGGVPEWSISADGLKEVQRYLHGYMYEQSLRERSM